MQRHLLTWIGQADIEAARKKATSGPILACALHTSPSHIHLLSSYPAKESILVLHGLEKTTRAEVTLQQVPLGDPTSYPEIWEAASKLATSTRSSRFYNLSSGTPAMASIWLLLGLTKAPACLLQASHQEGVQEVELPLDLRLRSLEALIGTFDEKRRTTRHLSESTQITSQSPEMQAALSLASRVARRTLSVLIQGESGTGKELLARRIHAESPRRNGSFVPINCGALPSDLLESELFGHVKGAFTGAHEHKQGLVQHANGGTLFLDEIGDLPLAAQVKLLRMLQERRTRPVGGNAEIPVDVRIVAATHRNLHELMDQGRFREDLYHRLCECAIRLPPLKERREDLPHLIESLWAQAQERAREDESYRPRTLGSSAFEALLRYDWPGNIRELENALGRLTLLPPELPLDSAAIRTVLPVMASANHTHAIHAVDSLPLESQLDEIAKQRISSSLKEHAGHLTRTAHALGFSNHQTLRNWMKRLGLAHVPQKVR